MVATLTPWLGIISGASARQLGVEFVPKTWRQWLVGPVQEQGAGLDTGFVDDLLGQFPTNQIRRADLAQLALRDMDDLANLRLLIATLMWGRGKKNGRMLPHMMATLSATERAYTLRRTGELAATGDAARAYRAWNLPGLGPPFFTKWFWAAAGLGSPERRLLVLDSRVRASLRALGWDSAYAAGTRERASRYAAYVGAIHRWATLLSHSHVPVSGEDVECALFQAAGAFTRLVRRSHSPLD